MIMMAWIKLVLNLELLRLKLLNFRLWLMSRRFDQYYTLYGIQDVPVQTQRPRSESIVVSTWPVYDPRLNDPEAERQMAIIIDAVRSVRAVRNNLGVAPSRKAAMLVVSEDPEIRKVFEENKRILENLVPTTYVAIGENRVGIPETAVMAVFAGGEIFLPLEDLIDIGKEIERLSKERERLDGEIARVGGKLSNTEFTSKAPPSIVEAEREKLSKYEEMQLTVLERLTLLKATDK
jgi:valyl-tRNA synthetase